MGERAHRDKVHPSLGIGSDIFQINSARTLEGNAPLRLRTALDRGASFRNRHIVEQNGFGAVCQRFFQLGEIAHFDFNDLRSAPVAVGAFECRLYSTRQRDVIVFDQHAVG